MPPETIGADAAAQVRQPDLRPYQAEVVRLLDQAIARRRLMVLATGGGKTVIAAELIRCAVQQDWRVLFLVHRRELLGQASRKLAAVGIEHGLIAAGFPSRPGEPVQIASIATLHARAVRSAKMTLPPADLVIVDEAHHATAESWRKILDAYPEATILGMTATPCRKSGTGLGNMFEVLIEAPQVGELIDQGFLVGTRVFGPAVGPDLRGVHSRGGDYIESEVAARVDRPELVGDVVTEWFRHNPERRRTIAFAASVAHSLHIADAFRAAGVVAEHLDGTTPGEERDRILQNLADGVVDVVVNVGVLTEGFDAPDVACIIIARPTKSFGLYRQMIGRGLRPADGKPHCIVLDHAGVTAMHGFAEDHVNWTLDTTQRAQSAAMASTQAGIPQRELVACPECGAFHWRGRPCGACGWRPQPKAEALDAADEDLVELKREGSRTHKPALSEDQKIGFYRQLLWIARERGYADGWAWHKVNEKFGQRVRTPRNCQPVEPEPATRSWVRSRLIAYAKARAKAGAEA